MGKPMVVNAMLFSNVPIYEFCGMVVVAAEVNSEQSIAKVVIEYANKLRYKYGSAMEHVTKPNDFKVHPGAGVSGNDEGKLVLVGNKRFMQAYNVPLALRLNINK
uniref:Uncharacterized protein n=1 Tax=Nelumbo nucifera TaxID=4432 RepID=A0A822XZC1_NELNU|nr:TPA_asm: hypothetical protein HUJ06_025810 [Nelumbo nucifera]